MGNPMNGVKPNGKLEIFEMMHSWDLLSFGLHLGEGIGGSNWGTAEHKEC